MKHLILLIEENKPTNIWINFKNVEELKNSSKYFVHEVIVRSHLADKFAEATAKFGFLSMENLNFKTCVLNDVEEVLDEIINNSNVAGSWNIRRTLGVIKFFGELFKVQVASLDQVKKYYDVFESEKNDCEMYQQCFDCLTNVIKEKLLTEITENHSFSAKMFLERIQTVQIPPAKSLTSFELEQFPGNFPKLQSSLKQKTSFEITETYKNLLKKLTKGNASDISSELAENIEKIKRKKDVFCVLIAVMQKALYFPDLVDILVEIIQKLVTLNGGYKELLDQAIHTVTIQLVGENKNIENVIPITSFVETLQRLIKCSVCKPEHIEKLLTDLIDIKSISTTFAMLSQVLMIIVETKIHKSMKTFLKVHKTQLFKVLETKNFKSISNYKKKKVEDFVNKVLKEKDEADSQPFECDVLTNFGEEK